jgi:ribosomal protein L37AE/L43A
VIIGDGHTVWTCSHCEWTVAYPERPQRLEAERAAHRFHCTPPRPRARRKG